MANKDIPIGLEPYLVDGSSPVVLPYVCNVTTAVYKGDIVSLKSTGTVHALATTTGSDTIVGVAAESIAASADEGTEILIYGDPDQLFSVQMDAGGVTTSDFAQTLVGNTCPMLLTTGDTLTGLSKQELDSSAIATGTADPFVVMGKVPEEGNDWAVNVSVYGKLRKHFLNERKSV